MKHSLSKKITAPILSTLSKAGNLVNSSRNDSPILISGSPRGGTTWIAESVAEAFGSKRMLWEPLQEGNIHKSGIKFSKRPFVVDENITEEQKQFFEILLKA
jgi:5-enolpyruvylshikimate-3-phosphate synthase